MSTLSMLSPTRSHPNSAIYLISLLRGLSIEKSEYLYSAVKYGHMSLETISRANFFLK